MKEPADGFETAAGVRMRPRRLVPVVVVFAMGVGEPVAEILVVIRDVGMVDLQPNARNVDRVDVRRKAPMGLVDVTLQTSVAQSMTSLLYSGNSLR